MHETSQPPAAIKQPPFLSLHPFMSLICYLTTIFIFQQSEVVPESEAYVLAKTNQ